MMCVSEQGIALIKRFEGFSPTPYLCPAGYWTIGYGHVVVTGDRLQVTRKQAEALLREDVRSAEVAVKRLITAALNQHQFDALVSFTFNLGAGALQRSTLRQVVNRGAHEAVPRELARWVFAAGRKLPGLVARRKAEAAHYSSPSP